MLSCERQEKGDERQRNKRVIELKMNEVRRSADFRGMVHTGLLCSPSPLLVLVVPPHGPVVTCYLIDSLL